MVTRGQYHTGTDTRYRPLPDVKPNGCGQQFVAATADQHIYKVMIDNIWATPGVQQCVPTIGRITHTLTSFGGSVDKLTITMDGCPLKFKKHSFGDVHKMLSVRTSILVCSLRNYYVST